MSTERDELIDIIDNRWHGYGYSPEGSADAILASGYRKPRTITTVEELNALPVRSVIRGNWLAEKWAEPEGECWHIAGKALSWFTEQLASYNGLPATVLYEPTP